MSRYIDAELLKADIRPFAEYESNRNNKDWIRRIEVVIDNQPTADVRDIYLTDGAKQLKDAMWVGYRKGKQDAQQWIPCSERLPEESGDYLVTAEHHSGELWVEVDQFDNANGSWWLYMDEVTAWMPLPEPYKGEES